MLLETLRNQKAAISATVRQYSASRLSPHIREQVLAEAVDI